MNPIATAASLRPGDVLHHAAFGFAIVESGDAEAVRIRWETSGADRPVVVSRAALATVWKRCADGGLLARSVSEPTAARAWLEHDPVGALAALIAELESPVSVDDVRDWLTSRQLVAAGRFRAWWEAVEALAERDPRLTRTDGAWSALAPDAPPELELPSPGSLPDSAGLDLARSFALALGRVHARGRSPAHTRADVRLTSDGPRFGAEAPATDASRRDDVRWVARLVLEQVTGPLPDPEIIEAPLIPLVAGACPGLHPELLGILTEALASTPELRPSDGLNLAERLEIAAACATLRARLGWVRGWRAVAGFDSHIGLLKSLQSQTNQDSFLALGEPHMSLLAVFDGISQSNAGSGDLASQLAARAVRSWWVASTAELRHADSPAVLDALDDALARANEAVCEGARQIAGADLDRMVPMGTTAVVAVTLGNRVHVASLGDSRAYVVGRHGAALLTSDDNVIGERIRDAIRTGGRAWSGDARFALTGFLGRFDDAMMAERPTPFTRVFDLLPGEWLVLCSDGLVDYAAEEEAAIAHLLRSTVAAGANEERPGLAVMQASRTLVNAANRGGGGDNITVLALTLVPDFDDTAAPETLA